MVYADPAVVPPLTYMKIRHRGVFQEFLPGHLQKFINEFVCTGSMYKKKHNKNTHPTL